MRTALAQGRTTSKAIVREYLIRIGTYEDKLHAAITVNPKALDIADERDRERAQGRIRGPLHGIPIALKDNVHTTFMRTTGGALAFEQLVPPYDATLTRNLVDAGAIIIAKAGLTELANWVAGAPTPMPGNYNAVGGQGYNPFDPRKDPRDATFDGRPALGTGVTGSKAHNIALRGIAAGRGLKLNEYGLFEGAGSPPRPKRSLPPPRPALYRPELREDHGEIEAARQGKLPHLVTLADIRGDLHVHTTDERRACLARRDGAGGTAARYAYIAITDHSKRVTVARGLDAEAARPPDRRDRPVQRNPRVSLSSAPSRSISSKTAGSICPTAFWGGSISRSARCIPPSICRATSRPSACLKAMDNPHIAVIAHPTGRLIDQRGGIDLDIERVLTGARERGCALEVNGQPDRLDLNEWHCKLAKDIGVKLVASTDAHSTAELGFMRFASIRRAAAGWNPPMSSIRVILPGSDNCSGADQRYARRKRRCSKARPATAADIVGILGPVEDAVLLEILETRRDRCRGTGGIHLGECGRPDRHRARARAAGCRHSRL